VPPLVGGDKESGFVIDYSPNEVGQLSFIVTSVLHVFGNNIIASSDCHVTCG